MAALFVMIICAMLIIALFPHASTAIATMMIAFGLVGIAMTVRVNRYAKPKVNAHTDHPRDFELQVADMFRRYGYHVVENPYQGDGGIDLKVFKDNEFAVVQCKRYAGVVGEPIVRNFFGALQHEGADHGFIVITGTFTKNAYSWAKGKRIILVDGVALQKMFQETAVGV